MQRPRSLGLLTSDKRRVPGLDDCHDSREDAIQILLRCRRAVGLDTQAKGAVLAQILSNGTDVLSIARTLAAVVAPPVVNSASASRHGRRFIMVGLLCGVIRLVPDTRRRFEFGVGLG